MSAAYFKKNEALPHLIKAERLNALVNKELPYALGRAYQANYRFDEAITQYQKYRTQLKPKELTRKK